MKYGEDEMDERVDNIPEQSEELKETVETVEASTQTYADPNPYVSNTYNAGGTNGYQNNYNEEDDKKVMSMGDWLLTILAFVIPCAGVVLYFVWAFSKGGNQNRKNFCRAYLIVWAISAVLLTILYSVIFISIGNVLPSYY